MATRLKCWMLLLAVLLLGTAHADLVGHWTFDEGSGTTVKDSSGNGGDGTFTGNPQWVAGKLGGALEFNGADWVDCGDILDLTNELSIACWVNPAGLSGDNGWVARWDNYAFKSSGTSMRFTTPGVLDYTATNTTLVVGEWQHVAITFVPNQTEGAIFYLQGVEAQRMDSTGYGAGGGPLAIGNNRWGQFYEGMIDDVQVYDHILTPEEVAAAMLGVAPQLAGDPMPEDAAVDVPRDASLAWSSGDFAVTHDVYFGTSFDDVNDADRANPLGVLASQDQSDNAFDPDGVFEFGQIYYWRVDEVNGAPDNTIFKGDVWSFTAEPFSIPIEAITATASSANANMGPENTIGGIGLNEQDQHSTDGTTMWLSGMGDAAPSIQYEFDRAYKLDQLLVWNSNQLIESFVGLGAKDVVVEYSLDGATWTVLEGATQFNQATGSADYTANTSIDFGGAMAQYVKITITAGYGMLPQYGLSEVRFLYIPTFAREPQPAEGDVTDGANVVLAWRAGREAVSHQVYLGTDPNALDRVGTTTEPTYTANGLNYGTTYYWSITEVNEAEAVTSFTSDVWSFTTPDFGTVDNFDQYDDNCNRIFFAWEDGLGHNGGTDIDDCDVPPSNGNGGGSIVGNAQAPFAERTIVQSGTQSMPFEYDNAFGDSYATLTIDGQDWTASGVQTLSLFFYGQTGNTGQLYVKINNTKVTYDGDAADITLAQWLPWNIDLTALTGLQNVTSLTIGVDGASAAGMLYFDSIRLYPQAREFINPTDPGAANLVALWDFEGDYTDSVGGHNATEMGLPQIVNDPARGQVLSVLGGGDALDVPYSAALNPTEFSASLWANVNPNGSNYRSPLTSRDDAPQRGYIIYVEPGNTWQFWNGTGTGWNNTAGPAVVMDEWTHVGITFANDQKQLYINGRLAAEGTAALSLNDAQPLRIGAGATESPDGNYFFVGLIDEVRIYNQALTPGEMAWLADIRTPMHKPL